MSLFPWVTLLFLFYAVTPVIVCVPVVWWHRSIIWRWWEAVLLLVPFGFWLSFIITSDKGKSLSNAVIEPFLCGCIACMPIILKATATRFGWRADLAYFTGLLISCTVAVVVYFVVPALPE